MLARMIKFTPKFPTTTFITLPLRWIAFCSVGSYDLIDYSEPTNIEMDGSCDINNVMDYISPINGSGDTGYFYKADVCCVPIADSYDAFLKEDS